MWDVRFEGVTKKYRREGLSYRSLRTDIANTANRLVGRAPRREHDYINALDGIDLEIEEGSSYAIVGRNGAGKSTALRLIARITYPTEGRVRVRGRVGALIEIGAGVHPELSGRENIWLYGSFLGIKREVIRRRFDDIVEFAELEQFVDMQVKYYSSGMQLRLGFAIASYLQPRVFIVDESLAVGDGSFQAKCIRRMHDLSSEGTTIIFVSHELAAVEALCDRAIWLDQGRLKEEGPIGEILRSYNRSLEEGLSMGHSDHDDIRVTRASCLDGLGETTSTVAARKPLTIRVQFESPAPIDRPQVQLRITDGQWEDLIECSLADDGQVPERVGTHWTIECAIDSLPLNPRVYQVWCSVLGGSPQARLMEWREVAAFRVESAVDRGSAQAVASLAGPPVSVLAKWTVSE